MRSVRGLRGIVVATVALLLGSALAAAGCGATLTGLSVGAAIVLGGSDGGSGESNAAPAVFPLPDSRSVVREVELRLNVADAEGDSVAVRVEYRRLDLETDAPLGPFLPARVFATRLGDAAPPSASAGTVSADVIGLVLRLGSSGGGVEHVIVWDSTSDNLPEGAFRVEVRYSVVDPRTLAILSAADTVRETIGNDPPVATIRIAPGSDGSVSGVVPIAFRLADSTLDRCRIAVEFALASEPESFTPAAIVVGAVSGLPSAQTLAAAPIQTIAWQSNAPAGRGGLGATNPGEVIVRLTPIDEHEGLDPARSAGEPVTATTEVRNNILSAVRPDSFNAFRPAGSPVPIPFTIFDQESDLVDVAIEVKVGDGEFRPVTERPIGRGALDLSEGVAALESAPFPAGKSHRFLWDMLADVPDQGAEVRLRITPSTGGVPGLTVEIGPLPIPPVFPLVHEAGRDPGTTDVVLARLNPDSDLPALIGLLGSQVTVQEIAAPGADGFGTGFLERRTVHEFPSQIGFFDPLDGIDLLRPLEYRDCFFCSRVPALLVSNRARPGERLAIYASFQWDPDVPHLDLVADFSGSLPDGAVSVADAVTVSLGDDDSDDVVVLFRTEDIDEETCGYTLVVYEVTDSGFSGPVAITETAGFPGLYSDLFSPPSARLATADLDADGDLDVLAVFVGTSEEFISPCFLLAARNDRAPGAVISDVLFLEDERLLFPGMDAVDDAAIVGLDAADLDGDGAAEVLVSAESPDTTFERRVRAHTTTGGALARLDAEEFGRGSGILRDAADFDGDGRAELLVSARRDDFDGPGLDLLSLVPDGGGGAPRLLRAARLIDVKPVVGGFVDLADAVTADLDQDGRPDVAALVFDGSPRQKVFLLRNDGVGGFPERRVFTPPAGAERLFATDLDGDGDPDLVAPHPGAANVLRNPRPLGLVEVPVDPIGEPGEEEGWAVFALADLDGNGRSEIVGTGDSTFVLVVAAPRADGTLDDAVPTSPQPVFSLFALTHLGGAAGEPDVVAGLDDGLTSRLAARLVLAPPAPGEPPSLGDPLAVDSSLTIAAADMNGDGRDDLVVFDREDVEGGEDRVRVALRLADGGFAPPATVFVGAQRPFDFAVADANGDGAADLAVALADLATVAVLLGVTGAAEDVAAAPASPPSLLELPDFNYVAMTFADVTGDGRADLAVAMVFGGFSVYPQGADESFSNATRIDAFVPTDTFDLFTLQGTAAALDLDGDGREEAVFCAVLDYCADPFCNEFVVELGFVALSVGADGTPSLRHDRVRFLASSSSVTLMDRPRVLDADRDGRADALFPVTGGTGLSPGGAGFAVASPRPAGAVTFPFVGEHRPRRAALGDITGEGGDDIVFVTPDDELIVGARPERSRAAAAFLRASSGGLVSATSAPLAGASVEVPPGARRHDRTLALVVGAPLALPPAPGATVTDGIADVVLAPASPPLAVLPETETLTADATIALPLDLRAPALAPLAALDDLDLAAAIAVFRFEREADGGRGRAVPIDEEVTVTTDPATGRRLARFAARRFGVFQAAATR